MGLLWVKMGFGHHVAGCEADRSVSVASFGLGSLTQNSGINSLTPTPYLLLSCLTFSPPCLPPLSGAMRFWLILRPLAFGHLCPWNLRSSVSSCKFLRNSYLVLPLYPDNILKLSSRGLVSLNPQTVPEQYSYFILDRTVTPFSILCPSLGELSSDSQACILILLTNCMEVSSAINSGSLQ